MAHGSFLLEDSLPCDIKGTLEKSLLLFPDNQLRGRGGLSQNSQEAFFYLSGDGDAEAEEMVL